MSDRKEYTPADYAEAFIVRLKPLLQELIREEFRGLSKNTFVDTQKEESTFVNTDPINISDRSRYSSKQAAQLLKISRSTLKKYTDLGDIKCEFYKHNGRRFYTGYDIKKFWKAKY